MLASPSTIFRLRLLIPAIVASLTSLLAQSGTPRNPDNDWPTFNRDLAGTHFEYAAGAIPITYRGKNGKQYVAIMAAGQPMNNAAAGHQGLMVFSLP